MELSKKLVKLREDRNLSLAEASKLLGIAKSSLCDYENSSLNKLPGFEAIKKIAKGYNVSYQYLLDDNCENEKFENYRIGYELNLSDTAILILKAYNNKENFFVINEFLEKVNKELMYNLCVYHNIYSIQKYYNKAIPKLDKWIINYSNDVLSPNIEVPQTVIDSFDEITYLFHNMLEPNYALTLVKKSFSELDSLVSDFKNFGNLLDKKDKLEERKIIISQIVKKIKKLGEMLDYQFLIYRYEISNEFNRILEDIEEEDNI